MRLEGMARRRLLVAVLLRSPLCAGDIAYSARRDPALLPLSRDPALDAQWREGSDLPGWRPFNETWSRATRLAVEVALRQSAVAGSGARLDLPRVFVYPFPPAFANMSEVLAGTPWAHLAFEAAGHFPAHARSYFEFSYGHLVLQDAEHTSGRGAATETWATRRDGLEWTPSETMMGVYADASDPADVDDARCDGGGPLCAFRMTNQHGMPYAFHRGLARSYGRVVSDPKHADLYFLPDHFDTSDMAPDDLETYCAVVAPIWLAHPAARPKRGCRSLPTLGGVGPTEERAPRVRRPI